MALLHAALFALLLLTPARPDATVEPESTGACRTGIATLHLAFPAVLATYPDRRCDDCDGYIATLDCNEARTGTAYVMVFGGKRWSVQVADCESPEHAPALARFGGKWLADIDGAIWKQTDIPITPSPVTLCEYPRPPSFLERKHELLDRP